MRVAIPTYNRQQTIKEKSLAWLEKEGVADSDIYLFVHSDKIKKQYCEVLGDRYNVIVGVKEYVPQLQYMADYFDEGEDVLFMDDDLKGMLVKQGYEKHYKDLPTLCSEAFERIKKMDCYLWGVYPSSNRFFMRGNITYSFKIIIGGIYGMIIRKDKWFTVPMKTDYELTIKHWIKDGIVTRYNYLGADTQIYSGKGGLQGVGRERLSHIASMTLLDRYPNLVALKKSKSGHQEIRLKRG